MRIYLTGAGGFIGGTLKAHLERAGHTVIAHFGESDGPVSVPGNAEAAVNAAGRLVTGGSSPEEATAANTVLPESMGRQCMILGVPLIHLSTPGVCGLVAEGSEDAPYSPEGIYERSKSDGEKRLLALGIPEGGLTILRPDFVFGPADPHKLPLFRQVARGWFPVVGRDGPRTRPTHVRDVCRGVLSALPGGRLTGGVYNIGGPEVLTMGEVARRTAAAMDRSVVIVPTPVRLLRLALALGPLRPKALTPSRLRLFGTDRFVSLAKASAAGFTPCFSFGEAATDAIAWYRGEKLL
ncbi:MAG: NAD(P)-dependent oxidoreductase [Candidatus Fermentibacteraceae bacterium]